MAFSPDGKLLAEGSDIEGIVRVWEVATGRLLHKLASVEEDLHRPSSIEFSPDGKTVIASTRSNKAEAVHFWDAATGKHLRRFDQGASRLAVSPDGRLLAGSGGGLHLGPWHGTIVGAVEEAHEGTVYQVASAGNLVVTAGFDNTIRLWDAGSGKQRAKLSHEDAGQASIALSRDGLQLVSGHQDSVCLWDTATGRLIYKLPGHAGRQGCRNVGFADDRKHFFSLGGDFRLRQWDVLTGKALLEFALQPVGIKMPDDDADNMRRPAAMEMLLLQLGRGTSSGDGKTFVLDTRDRFHVFDTASGKDVFRFPSKVAQCDLSPCRPTAGCY